MGPLLGLSEKGVRQLGISESGHWLGSPGMAERRVGFNKHLAPGEDLSDIGKAAGAAVATIVNKIGSGLVEHDLYLWIRNAVTIATGVGLYGPHSPVLVEPSAIEDIWYVLLQSIKTQINDFRTFDSNQLILTTGLLPSFFAPEGLKARERLVHGFEKYMQAGHDKSASHVIRATIEIMRNHDVEPQDLARVETFNTSVATVNTTPTAVWMIINILANKKLHKALYEELQNITTVLPSEGDVSGRRIEVDISRVAKQCPLLQASYQEALRLGSIPVCNRSVLEDTVMVDPETEQEVVLKKGHRVVVPTFMLHMRETFWGEKAETFDPWRFLGEKKDEDRRIRGQAFVPYGGGVHLCPGRHFAEIEILAVASLMILGMEVQMADGSEITVPRAANISGALKPAVPMLVRMGRRVGWEDVEWVINA